MTPYKRIRPSGGVATALCVALVITWAPFVISPSSGWSMPALQTAVVLGLVVSGILCPRRKVAVVRLFQRTVMNPLVRALFAVGINPLGLVLLETRGRVSGIPRRTPVGDGRVGNSLWIVAEHGAQANYVRNIECDPCVRVRLRRRLRYQWVDGVATVLPDDDTVARQRRIVAWHPLRAFNAMNVRLLGANLLTVRIELADDQGCDVTSASSTRPGLTPRSRRS